MYPACLTLKAALEQNNLTPAELAQELQTRYHRRRTKTHEVNGAYIQGLIAGEVYAPDTLREYIAKILYQTVKATFPEYLIECHTLKALRLEQDLDQSRLAQWAGDYAHKALRGLDISAYERGHRYCHPDTRAAIAQALGMSEADVFPEYGAFG